MTSTKQELTAEQQDAAADAAAVNADQTAKLATYVQLTEVDAEVPNALQHLVAVGRLAFQEKISAGAFQEVLDAVWLYGPIDAAVVLGQPVAPPVQVATGATEGAPGTFTPEGSVIPADIAALATVLASPQTLWALGNHVVLVDTTTAYWDGTAWLAGISPGPVVADDQKSAKAAEKHEPRKATKK